MDEDTLLLLGLLNRRAVSTICISVCRRPRLRTCSYIVPFLPFFPCVLLFPLSWTSKRPVPAGRSYLSFFSQFSLGPEDRRNYVLCGSAWVLGVGWECHSFPLGSTYFRHPDAAAVTGERRSEGERGSEGRGGGDKHDKEGSVRVGKEGRQGHEGRNWVASCSAVMNYTPLLSSVSPFGGVSKGKKILLSRGLAHCSHRARARGIQGVKSDDLVFFMGYCAVDMWESFSYVCRATRGAWFEHGFP